MFTQTHAINQYTKIGIETGVVAANPAKLVVMLYEGAVVAAHAAIIHMKKKEITQKSAMISKAIMIIESGLRLSLDKEAGGEIADSLDALYAYMSDRLYIANIRNQTEAVEEVIHLLNDLKSAWESISSMSTAQLNAMKASASAKSSQKVASASMRMAANQYAKA
jgi:flagellar secretion chaperone FliS